MLLKQEGLLHRGPEFCQAFKFVIKLQISTLLQQLAESGEESVVLTANVSEGTADHLGSDRGAGFLDDHEQLQKQFLSYCTETRRFSVDDDPDALARSGSYGDTTLLSPTQVTCRVLSPGFYSRAGQARPRYERESSTSDSVFSPNRRKSSASSKSLDDDVAMLSGPDFPEGTKQLNEPWTEPGHVISVDATDKMGKYSSSRSPSARSTDAAEKIKHASRSPTADSVEILKQITLSSPSEYKGRQSQGHLGTCMPDPMVGPLSAPPISKRFSPSSSSSDSITFTFKSNTVTPGILGNESSPGSAAGSSVSPVNLAGAGTKPGVIYSSGGMGGDSVQGLETVYKIPFSSYGEAGLKSGMPSADVCNNNMYGGEKPEKENSENKYRLQYAGLEPAPGPSETSTVSGEGTEYQTESGETYRLHKKAEAKAYQRQMSSGRKQPKSSVERRSSDSMAMSSYDQGSHLTTSPFLSAEEKDLDQHKSADGSALSASKLADICLQPDLSKSFEESVKVQQTLFQFQSSLGLLSPLHRQFLPPGRMHPNRERSQSMSEFSVTSLEQVPPVRSRFPSSSYVENLDTPLVIDDEAKMEMGMEEGLDLSNKKRKMSVDDVYQAVADEQTDNPNISANQGEEQEYTERGGIAAYTSQNSSSSSSTTVRDDQSAKKYGKGNFIKVATGYQCRICCRVIRHMNNTTAHMRIHANIKPYKCQVCNQQFKYEVDRRYHFSKSHVDLFSKMYFPDDKKNG